MKIWPVLSVLLVCGVFQSSGFGQDATPDLISPITQMPWGLHVSNVSLSSAYFSESYPGTSGLGSTPLPGGSLSGSSLSASATINWAKVIDGTNISVNYSPSYVREFQFSNSSSTTQFVGVSANRKLHQKWTLAGSFQGVISDFNQLLFAPSLYSSLSAAPATLEELLAAMLTGQSTNSALLQLVTAAQANGSPQTAFFYGGRVLSASAGLSLSYAQSTRSTFTFSMVGVRTQYSSVGGTSVNLGPNVLIPKTTAASASLGWAYSLTPRTTVSVGVSSSRSYSQFADGYSSSATVSIARTLSPHWFVGATGGVGYITPLHETFKVPTPLVPQFGGSVGYKFAAQTLLGTYSRSSYDAYGLGASTTETGSGGWTWNRPGSSMGFSGSAGYSRLTSPGFPNLTSWTARASVSRKLQSQLSMVVSYSYARYPESLLGQVGDLGLGGVNVALNWWPSGSRSLHR